MPSRSGSQESDAGIIALTLVAVALLFFYTLGISFDLPRVYISGVTREVLCVLDKNDSKIPFNSVKDKSYHSFIVSSCPIDGPVNPPNNRVVPLTGSKIGMRVKI